MKQFFLLAFTLILGAMYGSNSLEGLKSELSKAATIEEQVHTIVSISYAYARSMPDSGLVYGEKALNLAIQNNLSFERARAYSAISLNHLVKSEYSLALEFQLKALRQYEELDSVMQVAGTESNISSIFMNQSDYVHAMDHAVKALALYESLNAVDRKAVVLENIGILFFRQHNYEKAQSYYLKASEIFNLNKDSISISRNKGNLGVLYSKTGSYDMAHSEFVEAIKLNRKLENDRSVEINLSNLGLLEFRRGDYDRALMYYDSAQVMANVMSLRLSYATNLGGIGNVYVRKASLNADHLDKEMLDKGIRYLKMAIDSCNGLKSVDPAIGFYETLSKAYMMREDYKSALDVYQEGERLKDSIHSVSNRVSIENKEALHQLAVADQNLQLKDQELRIKDLELNKSRQTIALYILGVIILIITGVVIAFLWRKARIKNRKLKESNDLYAGKIEEQLASLKKHATVLDEITYMQAHHVREPVATILGMVEHFNLKDPHDPMNVFIIENLQRVAGQLDVAVREVINKKEEV